MVGLYDGTFFNERFDDEWCERLCAEDVVDAGRGRLGDDRVCGGVSGFAFAIAGEDVLVRVALSDCVLHVEGLSQEL